MELTYKGKKSPSQILAATKAAHIGAGTISPDGKRRMLIRGDNLPRKIVYADEMPFTKLQDIWEFKDPPRPSYPTEKNLEMLRTIVATSSTPDSIVLDCFAGSGTTLVAADQLNRSWIGIDRSEIAIKTALGRLKGRVEPAQTPLFAPTDDILCLAA